MSGALFILLYAALWVAVLLELGVIPCSMLPGDHEGHGRP
jgi:hypothetical protein